MLGGEEAVLAVAEFLTRERAVRGLPVVLDPVIRSSSGAALLDEKGLAAMHEHLLPLVDWITPNRDELGVLAGLPASTDEETEAALRAMHKRYPHLHLVATGGDAGRDRVVDLLLTPAGERHAFAGPRVETSSTHGTGCAFSSALLARLVQGFAPADAVGGAKAYVTEALRQAPGLGEGRGPLHLLWPLVSAVETPENRR